MILGFIILIFSQPLIYDILSDKISGDHHVSNTSEVSEKSTNKLLNLLVFTKFMKMIFMYSRLFV